MSTDATMTADIANAPAQPAEKPDAAAERAAYEKHVETVLCAMFHVKDSDAISRPALRKAACAMNDKLNELAQHISYMTHELYCLNQKHPVFNGMPDEARERFEAYRRDHEKGKIIIPRIVLGKR